MAVEHLTQEAFEAIIKEGVSLVDFWASWCAPCKMLLPTIDQLGNEMEGKAVVGKVNVEEEPDLASQFGVQSIPTVILFKDGAELTRFIGAQPIAKYTAAIEAALQS